MGRLLFWTGADLTTLKRAVGSAVTNAHVEHEVLPLSGQLPELHEGDVCVSMGGVALKRLQSTGHAAKNRALGSLRGTLINLSTGVILPTYDPSIINIDISKKADIDWDVRLAIRYLQTGSLEPQTGEYTWVKDFGNTIDRIKDLYVETKKRVPVSIDLETLGLYPRAKDVWIVSISVTMEHGKSECIRFNSKEDFMQPAIMGDPKGKPVIMNAILRNQIYWLNNSNMVSVRGANYKFDMVWMSTHWQIDTFNAFKLDTQLVGSLLNENRSNSLNNHAKIYTDMGGYDDTFNKTFDKSRMDLVPDGDLLLYGGGDTDACYRASTKIRKQLLTDKKLANFYVKLLHPAAQAFRMMEHRGMVVNTPEYERLKKEVVIDIAENKEEIFSLMSRRLRNKYKDNLSLGRAALLDDFLFSPAGLNLKPLMHTEKTGKPSTAIGHFELLAERSDSVKPFLEAMRNYNSATKTLSTYIVGFMKHLREDGRFHPSYHLGVSDYGGTVTGRTSATDPAYQTIPKHTKWAKPLRRVYTAPEGFVLLNVDYSQGELRIAACVTEEDNMISAYQDGLDMHIKTGAAVFGLELEDAMAMKKIGDPKFAEIRQGGKAGNFGLLYGMSAGGFQHYAQSTYGVHLSGEEASNFRNRFFEMYPRLLEWHGEKQLFARKHGYVRSPLGRIRHLPLINSNDHTVSSRQDRQAINSPIQSTLSDLGLYAMGILHQKYPELWQFGFTHDAISFYVPEDKYMEWAIRIKDVMENLPLKEVFNWDHQLQFLVDGEMGQSNMAELKEFKIG